MVLMLILPEKLDSPGLIRIKRFRNKGYDAVMNVGHNVTNKILFCGSSYVFDVLMLPRFGCLTRKPNNRKAWS